MTAATYEVEAERRAAVAIDDIVAHSAAWQRSNRRPRAITAREALVALEFEALFVMVAAANLAQGIPLTDEDRQRCAIAYRRIDAIVQEAAG